MIENRESPVTLEVIACTLEDAKEAERGGAHRLEIISHFELGGLTPSLELVKTIRDAVNLPLRVMLRESEGFEVRDTNEIARLEVIARELNALAVEGIVLGFLHAGSIDIELTRRILGSAPGLRATFHRAFDDTGDKLSAIRDLFTLPQVDRILTSGGPANLTQQIHNLTVYDRVAAGRIRILAGGGLDRESLKAIRRATPIREFHIGRAAREPMSVESVVSSERVREILEGLHNR